MSPQHKYDRKIIENVEESLSIISEKIEPHSVVLDIGCSSGMLGKYIVSSKACIVDGVDLDSEAIKKCAPIYRKVVIKNLDKDELLSSFIEQSYDYIVVADVIEHLYDVSHLISQLRLLIKPAGTIIFSVPNISHIASALELLYGNFDYRQNGLLDSTHIRFFSFDGLIKTLESSGLYLHASDSVKKAADQTEYGNAQSGKFPKEWLDTIIASRPDALVYQWIISTKIYPSIGTSKSLKPADKKSPLFTTAMYWTSNAHSEFNETNKVTALAYRNRNNDIVAAMRFDLDDVDELREIRFDPVSEPAIIWIKDVAIKNKDDRTIWKWDGELKDDELAEANWLRGKKKEGGFFYSAGSDPRWHIKLDPEIAKQIDSDAYLEAVFNDDRMQIDAHLAQMIRQDRLDLQESAQQIASLHDRLSEAETTAQKLVDEIADIKRAKSEIKMALADFTDQVTELNGKLESSKAQVAEMYRSRSWRITAPLRKLTEIWRGK
jgi:methionine biosynthesis protein MetW